MAEDKFGSVVQSASFGIPCITPLWLFYLGAHGLVHILCASIFLPGNGDTHQNQTYIILEVFKYLMY